MTEKIEFNNFSYFPLLHTRSSEQEAFLNLNPEIQEKITPFFILHNRKGSNLTDCLNKILKSYDRPFFLSLPSSQNVISKLNYEDKRLFDNSDNFKNWIELVCSYDNAIPTIQIAGHQRVKEVIKQATSLENAKGKISFRIRNIHDLNIAIPAIAALDNEENAMIFIDVGYIDDLSTKYELADQLLGRLTQESSDLNCCILSSSFPQSPALAMKEIQSWSTHEIKGGIIQQKEKELFLKLSDNYMLFFGDYAAVYPLAFDSPSEGRWSARIDFCTFEDDWVVFRYPKEHGAGYEHLARHIMDLGLDGDIAECWGLEKIKEASKGMLHGRSPSKWVEVRVNTHITHQVLLTTFDDDGVVS